MSEEERFKLENELLMTKSKAQMINLYLDKLDQLQQKENIIKEVRKSAERELKIAEENIKNSEQWLEIEEEQEHAKKDIHTGKVIKRCMKMFLEILDKGSEKE